MKKNLNADLASVNENLYDDLFIQKLETRLETDPLGVGGLVGLIDGSDAGLRGDCDRWNFEICIGENNG